MGSSHRGSAKHLITLPGLSSSRPAEFGDSALDRRLAERISAGEFDRPGPLHEKALRQYHRGDFADAAVSLTAALRTSATDPTAWSDLGVIEAAMGRVDLAIGCYDRALAIKPDHAAAIGNKGAALSALGRPSEALACYERVLALNPRNAENHNNRGGALRELGRLDEALASFDRALVLAPKLLEASNNRGATLVDLGRPSEALATFDKALRLDPRRADLWINRGNALARLRRDRDALASYDRALTLNPNSAEAHNNRGEALRALGRPSEAAEAILRALALNSNYPEAITNLGNMFLDIRRPAEALTAYDTALSLRPRFGAALGNRAQALLDLERPHDAITASELALALDPRDYAAHNARGGALSSLGREAEALGNFDAAIAIWPESEVAFNNRGLALLQIGRFAEGVAALERAIEKAPRNARAHYNLALVKPFTRDDPAFPALRKLGSPNSRTDARSRYTAQFALAKALADIGEYDSSFELLSRANAGKRATIAYDEAAALGALERAGSAYPRERLADASRGGGAAPLGVFIVGMPRSGTSLVEQVLASHPMVYGAGEISDFEQAALQLGGAVGEAAARPEAIEGASPDQLARLGASYIERIRRIAPGSGRIVNKMPGNFFFAGLIALALPDARIIHVVRDPRDTCVSCFATLFTHDIPYAYDLGELGRFHRAYQLLMASWRETLPQGMMLEVAYEDVVADLESEARRLVAHCDLPWDARCLDFHQGARSVRTASLAQVRRPLYASSVGRWRAYERHLGPLLQALGADALAAV